jgi:hypothetical protein
VPVHRSIEQHQSANETFKKELISEQRCELVCDRSYLEAGVQEGQLPD